MFKSKFTDIEKRKIVTECISKGDSIKETCNKYGITAPTFYLWKKKYYQSKGDINLEENKTQSMEMENITLRNLYINLSAHNFELAQFLKKNI